MDYLIQHGHFLDAVKLLSLWQTAACSEQRSNSNLAVHSFLQLQIFQVLQACLLCKDRRYNYELKVAINFKRETWKSGDKQRLKEVLNQ